MIEYIGVMDSGVGGLSVLKELKTLMSENNFIYFGDTKNIPYGTKTPDEIFSYTKDILNFFLTKNVTNVVFACNTTSAVAYEKLRNHFKDKLNIYPIIQTSAQKSVSGLFSNDTIDVLATKATVNSKKYDEEIHKINPDINVYDIDCTGFVEIVENRLYNDKKSLELIKSKLDIVKSLNAKRAILGCTHYPYLENIFKSILNIDYFNPAKATAQIVAKDLKASKEGLMEFYVTKNPDEFILSAKTFLDIKKADLVEL